MAFLHAVSAFFPKSPDPVLELAACVRPPAIGWWCEGTQSGAGPTGPTSPKSTGQEAEPLLLPSRAWSGNVALSPSQPVPVTPASLWICHQGHGWRETRLHGWPPPTVWCLAKQTSLFWPKACAAFLLKDYQWTLTLQGFQEPLHRKRKNQDNFYKAQDHNACRELLKWCMSS